MKETEDNSGTRLRAFIGCTSEQCKIASAFHVELSKWCYPELWTHGFFTLSETTIESLEQNLPKFDFSIFLLTPDDIVKIRGKKFKQARDNLILEVGMSMGILGRLCTFLVIPEESSLKLPTDIINVTHAEYSTTHPTKRAAMAVPSTTIREAVEGESFRLASASDLRLSKFTRQIDSHFHEEADALIKYTNDMIFSKGVVRRNWVIDLEYDFAKIDRNIIVEKMIWDYELVNMTEEPIIYPLKLFMLAGDENEIISFTRLDKNGKHISIFPEEEVKETQLGTILKRQSMIELEAATIYSIVLEFRLDHHVSPDTHHFHNAFASIQPSLKARIRARVPSGYRMDVLAKDIVPADILLDGRWNFSVPGPLLPEQIIEYVFQREVAPESE